MSKGGEFSEALERPNNIGSWDGRERRSLVVPVLFDLRDSPHSYEHPVKEITDILTLEEVPDLSVDSARKRLEAVFNRPAMSKALTGSSENTPAFSTEISDTDHLFPLDARGIGKIIVPPPLYSSRPLPVLTLPSRAETTRPPQFRLREATANDIDDIVDVDMRSFSSVYEGYGSDIESLRDELRQKFLGRFEKVGGEWMPVLERDGKIVGFMTCCPTSKRPEEFKSWEETTDNGTLETTYDPNGKNIYVVTLSVLPEGSEGKDMLYAHQISKLLCEGYDLSFFESRLPGFRRWAGRKAKSAGQNLEKVDEQYLNILAQQYFDTRLERGGKSVPLDPLIRLYERIGCRFMGVVPNAYQDEGSMNFGVVCVYDGKNLFDGSALPFRLPENRVTRWVLGKGIQYAARSPKLINKLFN